jgi:hypothetical protein
MVKEEGSVTLPLSLVLAVSIAFGLGTWGLLRNWRSLVEIQLRLDRCAGETARELRVTLRRTRDLNQAIFVARTTLAATVVAPQVAALARKALQAAVAGQEMLIAGWNLKRGLWLARQGCGGGGRAASLPALPWTRDPPDLIGPQALRWTGGRELRIQLSHGPRHAAAVIEGDLKDGDWRLSWTRPLPFGLTAR